MRPFKITDKESNHTYKLDLLKEWKIHSNFHDCHLKKYNASKNLIHQLKNDRTSEEKKDQNISNKNLQEAKTQQIIKPDDQIMKTGLHIQLTINWHSLWKNPTKSSKSLLWVNRKNIFLSRRNLKQSKKRRAWFFRAEQLNITEGMEKYQERNEGRTQQELRKSIRGRGYCGKFITQRYWGILW